MKLHLPVKLRAALLAVLLCSPMAMGNVKVYQGVNDDGTGGMEVIPVDGKIDIMNDYWSLLGDVVITVDGETTGGDGLTDLTYSGNTENCRTTITVESGGTFTCQSGSMIGTATDYASPPIESETIFNVSGGTVDLGSVGVGVVSDDAANARSSVIFNISENGQVLSSTSSIGGINGDSSNHSEVTMNLTSGGKLKIGSTTFGGKFGLVENTDSSSVVTISVDGENSSVELGAPSIGNVSAANSTSVVDIDVTQHGSFKLLSDKEGSEGNYSSGSIGTVSSADSHSDVYITVAGEGSLFEIASYWQTIGTVSTRNGGVQHLGSSTTKIEVREGGVFTHKMGDVGLNKSTAATPKGGSAATTELMLTVDGGTYNMGFCDDRQGSHLGGVGTPATDIHGKNTTEIYVQNKGQFNFQAKRGYIGASYNDGSDVTLNIFLDKGGVFSFERYEDDDTQSQVETHIGYACGGNVNLTLDVGADSQFNVLPQSKAQQIDQSIGAAKSSTSRSATTPDTATSTVNVYLHDGGTMTLAPTTIEYASAIHLAGMGISYAQANSSNLISSASAKTIITVGNEERQTEAKDMGEDAVSTFNFESGDIGLALISGSGNSKVENTTAITVNEGGQFKMTGGRLGYAYSSTNGKGTVNQSLSLTLNGGDMMITGGSILASEAGRTASASERTGSIELSGDSVLTIGKDVTIGDVKFDITMHGGTLAGEGISKLKGDVSINTGEGFTGAIGLGGIEAEKITSIKINNGDIAIVDIGTGTLTLDTEDILTVGEKNVWEGKGVSDAPEKKQALLQFKATESGSPSEGCIVDVNGKITLNFDGQYLATQKDEDGTVTLRVWITNGKLKGEGETSATWAEEHFEIGTGWGLEVTSYDAAQGMLILEGTSTVWVATVDGDDGNSHAAADASDLGKYTKVIVDEGTTFTADGGATIRQLEGQNGSKLDLVKGEGIESATITLENIDKKGSHGTGDTVFDGSITAGEGVNLRKTGDASLTVQGTLQAKGDVSIEVGELVLEGDNNTVAGALSMGAEGRLQVKQALTLSGTSHLTAGTMTGSGTLTVAEGGELSIEADSGWTLGVSDIHIAGTLSQKKSPITAENIVVQAGGKWTQESDANYNPSDKKWVDQLTRTEVGQSIGVENTGTVEQKGTSVSADTITVAGTWTQDKVTLTDESVAQTWYKNHDVHAETRANSIVVQAGGNYNLMDGAISALGGAGDEPGTLDLQVSGTFTMSDGDVAEKGDVAIDVKQGGTFTMSDGNVAKGGKADITIGKEGKMTVDGPGAIGTAGDSGSTETTITVNGGSFVLGSGPNQSSIGKAGSFETPHTSSVDITVKDGGSFAMGGNGQIGVVSGDGDKGTTTINVNGGTFDVDVSGEGIGTVLSAGQEGFRSESHVTITVSGDGAFTLSKANPDGLSGGMIGYARLSSGGKGEAFVETKLTVKDKGSFMMSSGNLGGREVDSDLLTSELTIELLDQGEMQISGGKVGEGASLDLSDNATLTQTGGEIADGRFTLTDSATLTQSNGTIDGGSITLSNSATLTQSGAGTINGSSITLSGSATMKQDGGQITGGSLDLSGSATLTQINGTINGDSITLNGSASMEQTGGEIIGGTLKLNDGASLTQSKGTINGGAITLSGSANLTQSDGTIKDSSISLKGSATMTQDGGKITGGTLELSGGATLTQSNAGTISSVSITLSDSAAMEQTGGEIIGGTLDLSDGASLTQSKGTINGGSITLNGSATMKQDGGQITGGSLDLGGSATMTQSNGTINVDSITLSGSATMKQDGGQITGGTLKLSGGATLTQTGGQITGGTLELSGGATLTQSNAGTINGTSVTLSGEGTSFAQEGGSIGEGVKFSLSDSATMEQTGGEITGGTLQLSGGASLTQSDAGTISGASITLSGATMEQTGGEVTGGTVELNDGASLTQSGAGTISGSSITLSGSATMEQDGGQITGGSLDLSGSATLTQSKGTINGGSITLNGSATMEQTGGEIIGGTLELRGGTTLTQSGAGIISGSSITLSGEGTSYTQSGGSIGEGAAFSLSGGATLTQSNGTINGGSITLSDGAKLTQSDAGTIDGVSITLSDRAIMEQTGGGVTGGSLDLSGEANLTQSNGTINGSSITLDGSASLTQSDGTIKDSSISLKGGATMKQDGGQITDGSLDLGGSATLTQSNGTINVDSITLSGSATMTQDGGQITGGSLDLSGEANLTQSGAGTISGSSITLSGGATMEQAGGEIAGGTLELSGGATLTQSNGTINGGSITLDGSATLTQSGAGTINGTSVTLSGEGTSFAQEGGNIDERATFSLGAGAKLTLSGGNMNGAVTMEGEASSYDLGNQAAKGSITMHGGSLANAGNYAGSLAIQTEDTYTGVLDLGGVDAARITQVQIGASGTELRNLKSGSTLTLREGDRMVVGEQHVYREGQTEPAGGTMVQFLGGKGQISFDGNSALRLHLESEVLKGIEGQLDILFTNGSFSGMPEGGQEKLEAWLGEHFVLDAGLEDIKVLLLDDAEGGRLILTGSTEGIWIASRNGQNVDVSDRLNHYSAVIADEDLTLTLPTTQEETPTIVHQLQNDSGKHGDFIVKTESGAAANHIVQLHNANTNGDNGGTEFYGDILVEGTGLEAATLEKTGDAALNVYGNVESRGVVQVKEGTLALKGEANGTGTLAMSGGELRVDGTLALTGTTEMSEESSGSISGEGNVKLGSGASLTLAGGVSYEVQNTQLDNGARMSQKGGAAIKGGSITLSGEGTGYTQAGGTISGATFTLTEGAGFAQEGGSIDERATFSLGEGAKLTLSGGSMNGAVTMEGKTSSYDLGNQAAKGDIIMKGGSLANAGNYAGSLAIQTGDTYTGALDLSGVDAARITQVQIGASGTELRNLKSGSTLTFREGDQIVVGGQHVYREGQTEPAGGTMVQFQEGEGQIIFDGNSALLLRLESEVLEGIEGQLEIFFTNGSFSGMPEGGKEELEAWLKEHFVLDAGLEDIKVLLLDDAEGGRLVLTGSSSGIWIASRNGPNVDEADLLNHYSAVVADEDLTLALPTTQASTPTIVSQLQNDSGKHGDFIVKTESGAAVNHIVQLHNANTNGDNGGTEFYGDILVEGTGLEAATLEKTGDAALNVYGNVESSGVVQVKEGTLALSGEANSVGTLAMSGGELQVDGTLALTGATEMSEESSGSISGEGNVKLGSGASLTLAGGVSYEVQNTQLGNGARMSQKGGAAIKGGAITLSGEGTGYTQAGGTISGATFTLTEGAGFAQAGGSIDGSATFSLGEGAKLTLSGGSMNGSVTMEGKTSSYDLGNQAAKGSITMHGGSLANAGNYAGSLAIRTGDTYTGALDLGGINAARITSIQLAGKATYLTGLKEGSTLTLHAGDSFKVTEQNVWVDGKDTPEGKQAFFQFGTAGAGEVGTDSVVDVESGARITLNFVGQQIAEAVGEDGSTTLKVWITNGQLGGRKTENAGKTWAEEHFEIGTGWGLNVESYDADLGLLVLKGESNIWDAKANGEQVNGHAEANASEFDSAEKVIIDENTVVTVDQDATIHQLDGEGAYSLKLENDGEEDKTITLHNHGSSSSALGSTGDTVFGGDILAGDGVNLRKTGDAALEVQGSLKAEGDVAVDDGKLVLGENGEHSIGGELSLGEHGTLQVDGSLTLSGSMSSESAGLLTGQGTVILDGENVTFGDVTLGDELTFQMGDNCGSVDFGERNVTLSNLRGNSVKGREMTLTGGKGGAYSGTVDGRLVVENNVELLGRDNEACDLVIQGTTGQATLAADSKYNSLDNGGFGGTGSTLKIASGDSSAGAQITVNGNIVFRKGAETDFTINLSDPGLWTANEEHDATMLSTRKTIYIENGTKFVIDCSQKGISDAKGDLTHVVILKGGSIQEVEKYDAPEKNSGANRQAVYAASARAAFAMQTRAAGEQPEEQHQVKGAQVEGGTLFNQLYETPTMWTNGTESWIDAEHRTMSPHTNLATTSNSMSGLNLLWQDLNDKGLTQATQQVSEILALLDSLAATNPAAARQMMAAVAGSTLTSLSAAQNAALRNQMGRVRDHALQAARLRDGDHQRIVQENVVTDPKGVTVRTTQRMLPSGSTTHAWVEGTSFFSEQHSVGDESGYRLNSWGGAVGVDEQLTDDWSVGVCLSASYGDLEARAAEYAKGDMDTYAVGVWGQNHTGRWGNTLLALWAWNDASLRRTVNHGACYTGRSDADGYSIGAQWELTYDFYMNEEKTNVLQPLLGVAVMHAEMDGFSEKGAGSLGLNVKDQTRDTVTLALGARWLAVIGSGKAINRAVNTELHANVAQDLGDRRSEADVALQANPTYTRNVRGAKAGSTAFQFGAGVNVPVTPNSQIYANAGGELREHASSWNAALGVRMGF